MYQPQQQQPPQAPPQENRFPYSGSIDWLGPDFKVNQAGTYCNNKLKVNGQDYSVGLKMTDNTLQWKQNKLRELASTRQPFQFGAKQGNYGPKLYVNWDQFPDNPYQQQAPQPQQQQPVYQPQQQQVSQPAYPQQHAQMQQPSAPPPVQPPSAQPAGVNIPMARLQLDTERLEHMKQHDQLKDWHIIYQAVWKTSMEAVIGNMTVGSPVNAIQEQMNYMTNYVHQEASRIFHSRPAAQSIQPPPAQPAGGLNPSAQRTTAPGQMPYGNPDMQDIPF